jgi:hypothetical protein
MTLAIRKYRHGIKSKLAVLSTGLIAGAEDVDMMHQSSDISKPKTARRMKISSSGNIIPTTSLPNSHPLLQPTLPFYQLKGCNTNIFYHSLHMNG